MTFLVPARAVLYATDFEAITVLELNPYARERLQRDGLLVVHIMEPMREWFDMDAFTNEMRRVDVRKVRIVAEPLERRGHRTLMLFTEDDDAALLLKAAFLPGQRPGMTQRDAEAFGRGFLAALRTLA